MACNRVILPTNVEQMSEKAQEYNKKYLQKLDTGLEELKQIVTESRAVRIFLSHAWHEDSLAIDERSNQDLVKAAQYYDSLCWWLYEALTKAGFTVYFDLEQRKIRLLGTEEFMAKSVDESDIVLSVCTSLYHDRSEIAATGVGKEVNYIRNRIEREGGRFYLPLLVHYDEKFAAASELIPSALQVFNPVYVDGRNRDTFITNLWRVLSELFHAVSKLFVEEHHAIKVKAYVDVLSQLCSIPDAFNLETGSPVFDEYAKQQKDSALVKLGELARIDSQQDSSYSFVLAHPFHKMTSLTNIIHQPSMHRCTPYDALKLVLTGNLSSSGTEDELLSSLCDSVFYRTDRKNAKTLKNWINRDDSVLIGGSLLNKLFEFEFEVTAGCRMYDVNYLWLGWLYYLDESFVVDLSSLRFLSNMFDELFRTIDCMNTQGLCLQQFKENLRKISTSEFSEIEDEFYPHQLFEQRLQAISIDTLDPVTAVRMYRLVSIIQVPDEIDLKSKAYDPWKLWGQRYLDYFFARKMLLIESDVNTNHYLSLAKRLGCLPTLKQWDNFIDEILLCHDGKRCEEDQKILSGLLSELKMNIKSVMHYKDAKDRKIVEKLALLVSKPSTSPTQEEICKEFKRICPEIEWHVILSTLIPKALTENTQGRQLISLSCVRFLPNSYYNQLFDPSLHTFNPKASNHQGGTNVENGRHLVGFVQHPPGKNVLCFKRNPEFPMIEQAGVALMYGLFGYPGIPFSEVMRMNKKGSSLFLVSSYVDGVRADKVIGNADHMEIMNNLDEQRVGELIVYSILSNPEDGRLQNYFFIRSDRDPRLYKIVAIDIDHSFAAAIPQKLPGFFSKETKTCSMVFTLPLMYKPIADSIQERLRKLDVDELFLGWLDDLERLELEYKKLYRDLMAERKEYETTTTLTLPMNYSRLMHVYWKLKELKSFVMDYERTDETPQPTYMEALKRVEKFTGDRYEAVNESTLSVGERFKKSDGRLSSSMIRGDFRDHALHFNEKKGTNALHTIERVRETLRQKKQQHQKNIEAFAKMKAEFKELSAAEQEELFVTYQSRISATDSSAKDTEIQRKWLNLISECVCEWQRLIVRHSVVLSKSWFMDAPKTAFYNLTLLELHDCCEVGGEVLDILCSQKNCRLEGVILSSLDKLRSINLRRVLKRKANHTPLEFPDLKSIRFVKNINLKRILIISPKLRHLVIEDCMNLESITFGDINHLKSFQYDDIILQNEDSEKLIEFLKIRKIMIFQSLNEVTNAQVLKKKFVEYDWLYKNYQDLVNKYSNSNHSQKVQILNFCRTLDHADIYDRFINGKLVFTPIKDSTVGQKEFSFRQFANTLDGEFDLSELKYQKTFVSIFLSINIGYRKQRVSSHRGNKTEVWIVPKFMVEKDAMTSSKHLEGYLDLWTSPIGIFFTNGDWEDFSPDSYYQVDQEFDQVNNQALDSLYFSSQRNISSFISWFDVLSLFTLII